MTPSLYIALRFLGQRKRAFILSCGGVVFGVAGPAWEAFCTQAAEKLKEVAAGTMLTDAIGSSYVANAQSLINESGVESVLQPSAPGHAGRTAGPSCRPRSRSARIAAVVDPDHPPRP